MRGNSHVRFLGGDGAAMRCLYPTNAGRPRPATGTSRQMFCFDASKRSAQIVFRAAGCVPAPGGLLVSQSKGFCESGGYVRFFG